MSSINIAAFDPLFWLHHCNMDRYYYSWYCKMTNNFTEPLSPDFITQQTLNEPCAPFFANNVYETDWNNYEYGWKNCTRHYAKVSDIIEINKFPYTYEIIEPVLQTGFDSYISLTNVSIPPESIEINVYLKLKNQELDKDRDFAGSAFWFGIDQQEINCVRCKNTLTNFRINIDDFVMKHQINQENIINYNIIIEANGLHLKKIYTEEELVKDGDINVIVP